MPPPASRLPRFPASCFPAFLLSCFLASFPLFSFPSSFPSVPPSPLFAAFAGASGFLSAPDGVARERSMPGCRLASACRFLGGASRIPRVPPAFGWRVREGKLRRALDVGCGAGPLVGRGGTLVRAAAWCLSAAGADTEMEPPDMKKSAAPSVGSGAFVLHFTGRGGQSGLSAAVRSGEVALPVGLGFRCGPRVAGPFSGRVGPRHGDGTAVHEKAPPPMWKAALSPCVLPAWDWLRRS